MDTPKVSMLMFLIAALAGALGQYLYKSGVDQSEGGLLSYILNFRIIGGVFCYVVVMVLFVSAFNNGGSLTVLYPIYATTFIWAALIALLAYDTPIKPVNIGGMLLLCLGMFLMGK